MTAIACSPQTRRELILPFSIGWTMLADIIYSISYKRIQDIRAHDDHSLLDMPLQYGMFRTVLPRAVRKQPEFPYRQWLRNACCGWAPLDQGISKKYCKLHLCLQSWHGRLGLGLLESHGGVRVLSRVMSSRIIPSPLFAMQIVRCIGHPLQPRSHARGWFFFYNSGGTDTLMVGDPSPLLLYRTIYYLLLFIIIIFSFLAHHF